MLCARPPGCLAVTSPTVLRRVCLMPTLSCSLSSNAAAAAARAMGGCTGDCDVGDDCDYVFCRAMGSSSKMFFQMKRFDAGRDEGGPGWLLQAEPVLDVQPW